VINLDTITRFHYLHTWIYSTGATVDWWVGLRRVLNSKGSGGLGCRRWSKSLFGLELAQVLFDKMSQRAGLQTKEHKHACQGLVEVDADGVVLDLGEVNLDVRQACKM
jgi:hypothetical protein